MTTGTFCMTQQSHQKPSEPLDGHLELCYLTPATLSVTIRIRTLLNEHETWWRIRRTSSVTIRTHSGPIETPQRSQEPLERCPEPLTGPLICTSVLKISSNQPMIPLMGDNDSLHWSALRRVLLRCSSKGRSEVKGQRQSSLEELPGVQCLAQGQRQQLMTAD